ncbi:MAG: hypothetical protein P8N43_05985 [Alphaproteobacteria bacterium]|nr:hypothetical protein [Alphaproteobacteria bacterium]
MIRTTFTASALAAMVMLAGCVTVNETYTGVTNESKREFLEYAGGKTPVLVRAVNSPFSEGEVPTATIAAKHAKAAVNPSQVAFTAYDAAAAQPHFRVVMVFDPATTVSAHDVCKADVAPLVAERTPGELRIHSVFCSNDEPLAGTVVEGPAPKSLNDQAYVTMVRMAFENMFPTNDPEGPNERRLLTSFNLVPNFGFRRH